MEHVAQLFNLIRSIRGTAVEPGLTAAELNRAEQQFDVEFPPDLREVLHFGLPTGKGWPNWRAAVGRTGGQAAEELRERLAWPLEGMLFDIEHNSFWDPEWGTRPSALAKARAIATAAVQAAPRLVPVFLHRYLPTEPCLAGNPVLSVYQTDIIVYGRDLYSYLLAESGSWSAELSNGARSIRSWTRWMDADWE